MSGAPERIWLQRPCRDPESEWNGEVTWCDHAQEDDDTEYVRADVAEVELAAMRTALGRIARGSNTKLQMISIARIALEKKGR